MKLMEVKWTQLVHLTFSNGIDWTLMLRPVGMDGRGLPVYAGQAMSSWEEDGEEKSNTFYAAAVFNRNGKLLATVATDSLDKAIQAAHLAISSKQKGYGPDHRDQLRNWRTNFSETETGYDPSQD